MDDYLVKTPGTLARRRFMAIASVFMDWLICKQVDLFPDLQVALVVSLSPIMIKPHILNNNLLLTPAALYICAGKLPTAQVSTFVNREVISMV